VVIDRNESSDLGPAGGRTVSGVALSADKEQQFIYVADYSNSHVVVVRRKTLEVIDTFGTRTPKPGDFQGVHNLAVDSKGDLGALSKISKSMEGAVALWTVYPKAQKHITENDVLGVGRKCGLKDVKVVAFSPTHTALKFVIPRSAR